MPLLYAAKIAPDPEVGKMSLLMAAVAMCLDNRTRADAYVAAAKTRGVAVNEPVAPLEKCQ